MKKARIFATVMTLFALLQGAHANSEDLTTCFQSSRGGAVGKIVLNPQTVNVYWDIDDFTEASHEKGEISGFRSDETSVSGEAKMDRSESAGSLMIAVSKTEVRFLELDERKVRVSQEEVKKRVSCPAEASPLELAQD